MKKRIIFDGFVSYCNFIDRFHLKNTHLYIFEDSFSPSIEETKTRLHVGIPHRMRLMENSSEVFPNPTHTHTLHDLNVKTLSAEPLLHRTHSNCVFLSDPRPIIGHPCQ